MQNIAGQLITRKGVVKFCYHCGRKLRGNHRTTLINLNDSFPRVSINLALN